MSLYRATATLFLLIAIVFILTVSKSYLIPFVLALLIWYVTKTIKSALRRNSFIRDRIPRWLQNTLVYLLIFSALGGLSMLLSSNIQEFSKSIGVYEDNILQINQIVLERFNVDLVKYLETFTEDFNIPGLIQGILNGLTSIIGDGFMIILYTVFLLLEESILRKKMQLILNDPEQKELIGHLIKKIDHSFSQYLVLKTLVSFLTGFLSYMLLWALGVDSPGLWAILIFLFNFIPSIGSIIATAFPVLIAMLQSGEVMPGLWVLIGVGSIQLLVGNVIEPRVMGNSLNISPLVVIISLILWGAIWGIVGMILSVPITVMLIIILGQFESTRGLAILLSANGEIFRDLPADPDDPLSTPPPLHE
ncbi:MAG: AI-2E family transporter [Saprospiraceae bacterium]|nr:AI-2E family transporter [Saprospiraceae bacterium]